MVRARQGGVDVPTLLLVDKLNKLIFMERISGCTMKMWFYWKSTDETNRMKVQGMDELMTEMDKVEVSMDELAVRTGNAIASLHRANLIHGDLTTSNFMLRKSDMRVVFIDFGLSYTSTMAEDRAVDLYVLERAFLSTHTEIPGYVRFLLGHFQTNQLLYP